MAVRFLSMRRILLLTFCFLSSVLLHADEKRPFFQVEMEGAAGSLVTRQISHCIFSLPESKRPVRFAVGSGTEKKQDDKIVLKIGKNLPDTAQLFAADGILFAVPPASEVNTLTKLQADSLLAGELTQWQDGPKSVSVTVCILTNNPEDMLPDTVRKNKQERLYFSDEDLLIRYMADSPDSIAILPLASLRKRGSLKLLSVDGIQPGMDTIMNGTYKFSAVYRMEYDAKDPLAAGLAKELLSRSMAAKLLQTGVIPLTVKKGNK